MDTLLEIFRMCLRVQLISVRSVWFSVKENLEQCSLALWRCEQERVSRKVE